MQVRTEGAVSTFARGRRTDLGWSQAEVATRAGLSQKTVSEFETGKASPQLSTLLLLLDVLGITMTLSAGSTVDDVSTLASGELDLDQHLEGYLRR